MDLIEKLTKYGQTHLLDDTLPAAEREAYYRLLDSFDYELLRRRPSLPERGKIEPVEPVTQAEIARARAEYLAEGKRAVGSGEVAAVLLAGGQGTRLGADGPKGTVDIGITRPLYIFGQLIENLKGTCEVCGAFVPLFVMTSAENDEITRAFFKRHAFFGYPESFVRFFVQEMLPSVDFEGKILLQGRGKPVLSPNGNGGWYRSLTKADVLRDFPAVRWLNVFAVDNVLQRIADPLFVGATLLSGCACGAKVVPKASPEERVGVLCLEDGLPSVIEYYELSPQMANARERDGRLTYGSGVILNYLFSRSKLETIADKEIPVHIVKKKIPYMNERGEFIIPAEENGYKFETLILDMVRLAGSCLPFEVVREREFAPIKNRTGKDSIESARALLEFNGVKL